MKKKDSNSRFLLGFKSIRTSVLIPFSILIVAAVLCFMLISVKQSRDSVFETSTDYTMQLIGMINGDIDSYFFNMENIAQLVMGNYNVTDYLFAKDVTSDDALADKKKVEEQFQILLNSREDIYNIGIVEKNGNYFINDENTILNPYSAYEQAGWYQKALLGGEEITSSHVQNIVQDEYKWVVTLSRGIKNFVNGEMQGVLFIDLNYNSIRSLCEKVSLGSKGYVFIIDEEGNVIYHPKQQLLYSGLFTEAIDSILKNESGSFLSEEGDRLYTISKSETTGWTVVGVAYLDELLERTHQTQLLYIMIAVSLIAVTIMLSVILSNAITKPIRSLRSSMKRVEEGDLKIQIENPGYANEIGDLIHSFNIMIERIRQLIRRNVEEQEEKRKIEFRALQAQINPHFLYNTLDSIIWMAEGKKMKEVILMTSSLSKLLRRSISNQDEFVTIEQEVEYVKEYLNIQQMRYRDKLEYEIDVDEKILNMPIVKLVLQPIVENAIYHGIKLKQGKGIIIVKGGIFADKIIITVMDDGVGMEKEILHHIFSTKNEEVKEGKVGVLNVHRRIQLYYGAEYGLQYESVKNIGTTVKIVLPYEKEREKQ